MIQLYEIQKKARLAFPDNKTMQEGYVEGYQDALNDSQHFPKDTFFQEVASGLYKLWPSGEKDEKWSWRISIPNTVERLQFLWKEMGFDDKYSVDDCLAAARRYLAKFYESTKYMQVLKYFIFKQTKLVAKDGKVTYTTKSTLADMLTDDSFNATREAEELFESVSTISQGDLV